jgi:hypothetical protein
MAQIKKKNPSSKTKTTKNKLPSIKALQKSLAASEDPKLRKHAPHIPMGLRILDYAFACSDAANTVKAPRGYCHGDIVVAPRVVNKLTTAQVETAHWLMTCVADYIRHKRQE